MSYELLKGLLSKEDIPEVERVIRVVEPLARVHWNRKMRRAYEFLREKLDAYGSSVPEDLEGQVETLLATFEERLGCPLTAREAEAVEEAAQDLLASGWLAIGALLPETSPRLTMLASRDLSRLMAARLGTQSVRADLRRLIGEFLTTLEIRQRETDAALAWTKAIVARTSFAGWGPQTVDAWAYRWHNVGRIVGGQHIGVSAWVAVNPLDSRTTPFCRWVHGKRVTRRAVASQLDSYYAAIEGGQGSRLRNSWPLRVSSKLSRFQRLFRARAIPPYHFHCRTVLVPE